MMKRISRKHAKRKLAKAFLKFLKSPGMPMGRSLTRPILPVQEVKFDVEITLP